MILSAVFGVFLLGFAIYNTYPFITSDTGVYFDLMFTNHVPDDRPRFYGDFMRLFFIHKSLWPIVLVQSALMVWLILQVINRIFYYGTRTKVLVLLFMAVCTQVSWYTSQLMPDFTAPLMIFLLILYFDVSKSWAQGLLLLALFLFGIMHNSNFTTLTIFSLVIIATSFLYTRFRGYRKRGWTLLLLALFMQTTVAYKQYLYSGKFDTAPAKHIFLVSKLQNDGILQQYLKDKCPTDPQALCPYLPKIKNMPGQAFLWDSHIIDSMGGVEGSKAYFDQILASVYTTPKYQWMIVKADAVNFSKLIFAYKVGDGIWPYLEGTNPYWRFRDHLSDLKFSKYLNSKQNKNYWGGVFDDINLFYLLCSVLVFILFFIRLPSIKQQLAVHAVSGFIALSYWFLNGIICSSLTLEEPRLNSRLIWVITLMMFLILIKRYEKLKESKN